MARRNAKQVQYRARRLLWVPETGAYIGPGQLVPLAELGRSAAVIQMHLAAGNVVAEEIEQEQEDAPQSEAAEIVEDES